MPRFGELQTGIEIAALLEGLNAPDRLDHGGGLSGLGDDDHSQYLLADASRILGADWDIGDGRKIETDGIRARDGAGLELYDDGGNGIFVDDGGNVRIGTVGPGAELHISNTGSVETRTQTSTTGSSAFAAFNATSPSTGSFYLISFESGGAGLESEGHALYGSGEVRIGTYDASDLSFWTDNSQRVTIDSNGNVGINETCLTSKLHVRGLSIYANNAAARTGGLTTGAFYRTGGDPDLVCVTHDAP